MLGWLEQRERGWAYPEPLRVRAIAYVEAQRVESASTRLVDEEIGRDWRILRRRRAWCLVSSSLYRRLCVARRIGARDVAFRPLGDGCACRVGSRLRSVRRKHASDCPDAPRALQAARGPSQTEEVAPHL